MASMALAHPEGMFTIPALHAMIKCNLFQKNPALSGSPYRVETSISLSIFWEFFSALEGKAITITGTNFAELKLLCEEFGFVEFAVKLSDFRPSKDFKEAEDAEARGRIAALEEKSNQHDSVIAVLRDKVTRLSTDFECLVGEVSALRSAAAGIRTLSEEVSALKPQIAQKQSNDICVESGLEQRAVRRNSGSVPSLFQRMLPGFESCLCLIRFDQLTLPLLPMASVSLVHPEETFTSFSECAAKVSKFCSPSGNSQARRIGSPLARVRAAHFKEPMLFAANGTVIESDIAEAAAVFPAVGEQLSVDGWARKFFVNCSRIEAADIRSLQLLLSGEAISIRRSHGLLSRLLGNVNFELLFLGRSKAEIRMNLSDLMLERRIDLESVDVSVLSVEALASLLLSESFSVGANQRGTACYVTDLCPLLSFRNRCGCDRIRGSPIAKPSCWRTILRFTYGRNSEDFRPNAA
jgi:hypothetical protein